MNIGIGLPNAIPGVQDSRLFVDWARAAEAAGFSTLGTIGRVAWPGHEELMVLAAAAGATERIQLLTDVLLGPTREPVLLAHQTAALDRISGGRFVFGVGVGSRPDDFTLTGQDLRTRGKRWDASLDLMHAVWRGEVIPGASRPTGPRPVNGKSVPLMFGGRSEPAMRRAARWGIGFTQGGGGPELIAAYKARLQEAWAAEGRSGTPQYRALAYFALSDPERGHEYVSTYYGDRGEAMWEGIAKSPQALRDAVKAYADAGCDELVFFPTIPELQQLELLANAVLS